VGKITVESVGGDCVNSKIKRSHLSSKKSPDPERRKPKKKIKLKGYQRGILLERIRQSEKKGEVRPRRKTDLCQGGTFFEAKKGRSKHWEEMRWGSSGI